MNIPVTSGNLLEQFARTLMTSLDGNRDGQLSTTEFTSFLTSVMGGAGGAGVAGVAGDAGPRLNSLLKNGPPPLMAGFDPASVANPTTVKYKFAQVAQEYSLTSVRDMASAETLLRAMTPELEAAGITVLGVSRDKIQVLDDRGQTAWVDVIRGAGDYDPAFQWSDTRED